MALSKKKNKQPTMVKLMKRLQHLLREKDKAKKIEKTGGEHPEQVSIGKVFCVDDLRLMTREFSADNLLGSFPFANIYKGIFPIQDDDDAAAAEMMHVTIKVLLPAHGDVDPAISCAWRLKNELHSRSGPDQVNHLYLPNILGSCWGSGGIFAIVYKLNSHCILEKIAYKDCLSWEDRIHIAFKIALLLEYLHGRSPCVSVGNIASCHIVLDEARNPILYEFEMRGGSYYGPGHVSSGVENNTCDDINSFGHILISLLCRDEEERALNMYRVSGAIADWETCRLYRGKVGGCMSGRFGYKMTATSFDSHPNYRPYDAHKLSKLAIRCISEKRPCIGEIVGEFKSLFFIGVRAFASLPVNGKTVQELKFSDIGNITRGFSVLIGRTQFGDLYRGWFGTKEVTVKVFRDTCTTTTAFMSHMPAEIDVKDTIHRLKDEISLLRDVRSSILPSLPSLIAFCCEEDNVAVVYDFRTVCTLHTLISNAGFDWIRRIEVMNQVARLLQYMHNYDPCFILGNISSHHFLLDEYMQMVLVDFGMLTGGFLDMKKLNKYGKFLGAAGYMEPSVLMTGVLFPRMDIYGFGVLLIELVAKKRMTENGFVSPFLTSLIQSRQNEENHSLDTHSIISESLKNDQFYYDDDAHDIVKIALSILRHDTGRWRDINEIVHQLEGLMLSRPLKQMYQVMQKKSKYAASNSHTGSSSQ